MTFYKDKLFILSSHQNILTVFDTKSQKTLKEIKLPTNGFSRRITLVPNSNYALITNVLEKKYLVFDLEKETVVQAVNISTPINMITVVERK